MFYKYFPFKHNTVSKSHFIVNNLAERFEIYWSDMLYT